MEDFVASSVSAAGVEVDVNGLLDLLESLGVDSPADVQHVVDTDLIRLLKPIHARKLLAQWHRFV